LGFAGEGVVSIGWRGEKKRGRGGGKYSDPGSEASASMRLVLPLSALLKKRNSLSVIHTGSL